MTFLTPIPALIAAAITVPALLVLYFLRLRRRPIRVSSTLLWDQASRDLQVNIPFRIARPTLLLALQAAILACFLIALARPAMDLPADRDTRIILLIDRSASMSARDGPSGQTRLEAAKARAAERIAALSGSTFAVIAFAAEPVLLAPPSDAASARRAVASITPTDQPGALAPALKLAGSLVTGDASEDAPRRRGLVILLSDGSFAEPEPFALAGADLRFERFGGPEAPAPTPSFDNLGIVAVSARREWNDPAALRLFARIQNAMDRAVTTTVALRFDDREAASAVVTIPAADRDGPGSVPVSLSLATTDGGVATIRVDRQDLLEADNQASLVIAPATKPRVLIVVPDPSEAPRTEWIITNVIEELRLPMRVMTSSVFARETGSPPFDLIIFDRVSPGALPPVPTLSFGVRAPGWPDDAGPLPGTYFTSWQRAHPVLRYASPDAVYVSRPLQLPDVRPEEELARGADGPLIISPSRPGPRRIFVGFQLADSNWPVQTGFAIFLASAIDYLTLRADDRAGVAFSTVQPVTVNTSAAFFDGPRRIAVPRPTTPGESVNLGVVDLTGVYRAPIGPDGAAPAFAVNLLDPHESAIGVADSIHISGEAIPASTGGGGPREVWPWFIGAAAALLTIEWLINARMMRA